MPFQNVASKLVLVVAAVLVHHALVARSAPPGLVPAAEVPTNLASATGGVANTSAEMPLLDATKLPFLASCNADKISEKLCEQYRTLATTVLTHRTVEDVLKAAQEKMDSESFCDNLVPVVKNRKAKHPEVAETPLEKNNFCTLWCVKMMDDLTTLGVNPICKVLLWGFRQEVLSEQETVPEDLGEKMAGAVVPPLLAENVKLPDVVKNEESPVETKPEEPVATQPNITDPKKIIQEPTLPKSISGAADTKESASDTAAAKAPLNPAVAEPTTAKGATTVASKVQQKPTPGAADEATVDEDNQQLDDTDAQNEDNIIANNNDGNAGLNGGENTDEMYDDDELPQQPAVPKESQVKEERDPIDEEQRDTDFSVEQPAAAAAVQIERVDPFFDQDDSNFFSYFMFMMFACIACYVAYHNKSKLMALLVEGRRSNSGRGGFSKGRKHTAAYRKLDSNLEEAITSNASASSRSTSQIIY
nr:uncharacterized protein LOC115269318 [Aedes albopictus]